MSKNDYAHDEQLKDILIMSCIKRISINFKAENFHSTRKSFFKDSIHSKKNC
jgi:hypothetical protein